MSKELKNSNEDDIEIPTSARGINEKKSSEVEIQSTLDKAFNKSQKSSQNNFTKRKKITIIIISIFSLLIIASIILIIGHFKFGWFMKKNELVLVQNREVNLVSRYLEKKILN